MKSLVMACALAVVFANPGFCGEVPAGIRQLAMLGLEKNLGLKIEKTQVLLRREQKNIESAQFDSSVYGSTSFEKSVAPYESTVFSGELETKEVNNQVGVRKRFLTGAEINAVLSSQWISDNDYSSDLDDRYRTAFVVELSQPLLQGIGYAVNSTDLTISKNSERQQMLSYLLQVQAYLFNLENTYWDCLYSQHLTALRREALLLAQNLVAANQKKFAAGQVAITEVQEAETAVADRELSLSLAEQQLELQTQGLRRLINAELPGNVFDDQLKTFRVNTQIEDIGPVEELLATAQLRRLEYQIAELDLDTSRVQLAARENSLKPQLDLNLQAGINGLAGQDRGYVTGTHYGGNFSDSLQSMSAGDGYQWQVRFDFSMPLERRAAKARASQARHQVRINQYAAEDLDQQIRNEIIKQAIVAERAKEQLDIARRFADLAKTSLEQEGRRLHEGLSSTFRMITFQEKMVTAKVGHIQAITGYYQALAGLNQVLGNTFSRYRLIIVAESEEFFLEK